MLEKNEFNQIVGSPIENWHPVSKPSSAIMQGNYCILEPLDINKHAERLFETLLIDNEGELWTYLPYGPFDQYNKFKEWIIQTVAEDGTLLFAVIDAKTQLPVGITGYLRTNTLHGSIEVGHLHYSKFLKKTPAATEAMYLMMKNIFELGYRRYEWKCNTLNEASRESALRLGFQFEGIFRQCNVFKNRNRDTAWFSVIDSEWPTLKKKFEAWLDPKNFDANGKQITRLNKF